MARDQALVRKQPTEQAEEPKKWKIQAVAKGAISSHYTNFSSCLCCMFGVRVVDLFVLYCFHTCGDCSKAWAVALIGSR